MAGYTPEKVMEEVSHSYETCLPLPPRMALFIPIHLYTIGLDCGVYRSPISPHLGLRLLFWLHHC